MVNETISGTVWKLGDDIDTDTILPSQYMNKDPEDYAQHIFETIDPSFAEKLNDGDVIVGGINFGIGSSREQAAVGLQIAGVGAIVAESFARIFYRNSVNQGVPAIRANRDQLEELSEGDEIDVYVFEGRIENRSTGATIETEVPDEPLYSILQAGGVGPYYKRQSEST